MAREFAKHLYNSKQWQDVRNSYFNSKFGLCERCQAIGKITPGEIVHHKIYVSPDNINNTDITLNWDNLMVVCRDCHAQIHEGVPSKEDGLMFNEEGDLIEIKDIL